MIVALAGCDGVGKTTAIRLLLEELARRGRSARLVGRWDIVGNEAYPATRFIHPDIKDLRECVASMPPLPRFTFLMWTMHMALEPYVQAADASIVIVDGYWMKHAASEIAYGVDEAYVAAITSKLPCADLTLLLDAPLDLLYARKAGDLVPYECGMDPSCSRESFVSHQAMIGATLRRWQAELGWVRIDVTQSREAALAEMAEAISGWRQP